MGGDGVQMAGMGWNAVELDGDGVEMGRIWWD